MNDDVFSSLATCDSETTQQIASVLHSRKQDPTQYRMLQRFLTAVDVTSGPLLEIGCGSGELLADLCDRAPAATVVGIDHSVDLLRMAGQAGGTAGKPKLLAADAHRLPFADESFSTVLMYTLLSHTPDIRSVLQEAYRVCRPGGQVAVLDGDYASADFSLGPHDPLNACVDAWRAQYVVNTHDLRSLPRLLKAAGFQLKQAGAHDYTAAHSDYAYTIIDRGVDSLFDSGTIGKDLARSLKDEARRRAHEEGFLGSITYRFALARRRPSASTTPPKA
ncbi:methyltransferase domain-containing protein [Streptomyces sp. ASQP_92]|uniref:methyltransferase domain-containing protein n=1 Tax=Streptomyces sp. ASQP_92 TaxID=2979116 RepID=UPI0021C15B14|nr:methyltransferase domain-containing protein [Streptomyces sp. ASQP_92]MCT9094061.1 methyltransferase domain-containing protein [Streptomyces sp. ASQP_92]